MVRIGDLMPATARALGLEDELRLSRDPNCPTCSDEARAARERGEWKAPAAFGSDQPFALGSFGRPS